MMRTTVMEGSLSEFDLSSVIQVVSIGRQYTGVDLFDETGTLVGTLFLKSGKILEATSGSLSGLDAVTTLLRDGRQKRFSVYRTERFADVKSPVGSVGEVLLKLMQSEASAPERVAVMEGSLSEFDLLTVLQVISIGRQFTGVEVLDAAGKLLGRIELKAGKVVSATSEHLEGIDAIRRLLRSPRDSRFVVRRSRAEVGEHHLGSLAQILMKLADVDAQWDPLEPNTRARRPISDRTAPEAPAPAKTRRARAEEERPPTFVDTYTSPFGLTTLPLGAGEVPVVCITSPKGGAGKTTVALNLAVALARQGKRAMLVDADYDGVLLALNAKAKSNVGAYHVVAGRARLAEAVVKTRISGLQIVQSGDSSGAGPSSPSGWAHLFQDARTDADIVLVDTSAGVHGPSRDACAAATHVLVVIPAEPAAIRALPAHLLSIESLGKPPPKVIGIVLNMLDYRARVSLDVLRDLCGGPSAPWVFDIPIARSMAFMEAVARGVPLCRGDRTNTPTIGWVFEMLAGSILERLGIALPAFDETPIV
jgi:MinD-like ATPase involved in chromosome partitioning or flagellar assembly